MSEAYFIPYRKNTGSYNMEYDEKLLDFAIKNNLKIPILRFYGWSPACVSLGRNQNEVCINQLYCKSQNIEIVRRLTGGRALLHDKELTYSFVCPSVFLKNGESVIQSYKEISGALAEGFVSLGITADFPVQKKPKTNYEYCMSLSTRADLSFNGKKLVGSAQFRKNRYILQHGSIIFDYDKDKIKSIFGETPNVSKITTMKESAPHVVLEELCNSLKSGFEKHFNLTFQDFELLERV